MALMNCRFHSSSLNMATSMTVIVPQHIPIGTRIPTLYLLHGYSDDDSIWVRRTSIERYVEGMGIAVVMPQVHRSFYTDMVNGFQYWTFLSEELPQVARSMFPLSEERAHNFVAGLSMGGYGAFKWALNKPDFFAAAASLSGALVMGPERIHEIKQPLVSDLRLIFGEHGFAEKNNDLLWLINSDTVQTTPQPLLYQCCGTEDFLYADNILFRDRCKETSLSLTYEEGPGVHDWAYWDRKIQDVLAWLPIKLA
jgi:putative tributyrin esterase